MIGAGTVRKRGQFFGSQERHSTESKTDIQTQGYHKIFSDFGWHVQSEGGRIGKAVSMPTQGSIEAEPRPAEYFGFASWAWCHSG